MRKKIIAAVGLVALVVVSVAAAAQVNTYSVSASTNPTKAGSKKKPVPVSLNIKYTVGEASGQRPSAIKHYKFIFAGIVAHGEAFPKCTASQINAKTPPSDSGCPRGSKVGSGTVDNLAGPSTDPATKSSQLPCRLSVTAYSAGAGAQALFIKGGPPDCPLSVARAIPTVLTKSGGSFGDEFDVPSDLLHPAPGIDNSVVSVDTTFPKALSSPKKKGRKGKKAKKVGYLESQGGCTGGKRKVSVEFTSEAGQVATATTSIPCKK